MKFVELNEDKSPKVPELKDEYYKDTFEQWNNAGLIIGNDVIILDFDGDNSNEDKIINYVEKNYPTLTVTTTRGKHYYYSMPQGYNFKRRPKTISVMGFQCDYLTGEKAIATIKLNGTTRQMNMPLSLDNLPELPEEFYPLPKTKNPLSGMIEGDARNDKLFYHLRCVRETYHNINIHDLAVIINSNAFIDKLPDKELKSVLNSVKQASITPYKSNDTVNEIKYSNARELQDKNLPPITFYVENLLPQGLNLICSLPKIGKSFMAFDLCLSISRGLPFLGFKTTQAGCLYLALEDSENRLQDRLKKILNGEQAPSNFFYTTKCDDVENGLIEQLKNIRKKEPSIKVIVIDTLQKIRSNYKGGNNYANDYQEIGKIKEYADEYGLCIILIHHLKKGNENDVFGKVSGTNGITGTADTTIVLDKENRADKNTVLSIVGRDVEFNKYIVNFDKGIYKWNMVASYEEQKEQDEKEEYQNNPLVDAIKTLVNANDGKWSGSLKSITEEYKKLHPYIDNDIRKNELKQVIPLLKKYDSIDYFEYAYPVNGVRPKVFTRLK